MTTTPGEPTRIAERTWKPTTAGILSIIAGASGLIGGIVVVGIGGILGGIVGSFPELRGVEGIGTALFILGAIGIPLIVFGAIAIVGGIFALRRRIWGLALAGSICALFGDPVEGILAIIFVAKSRREFDQS